MAAISQREIGADSHSFARALRSALREDPDVLLVGEMRDPESIQTTLTIAETGHLVFASLHTNDTAQSLDRIVDVFPADSQAQVRVQLAGSLAAVIAQRLIPRIDGGRVAAFEVLVANHAVRNLIKEGKTRQIRNVVLTGQTPGDDDPGDVAVGPGARRRDLLRGGPHPQPVPGRDRQAHPGGAGRSPRRAGTAGWPGSAGR